MDNEIKLSDDLNIITAEINSYKQVAGQAIFEIGRRLKHVKENDLSYGEFGEWLNSIGFNNSQASMFVKVYEEIPENDFLHVQKLSSRALYEIATMPEQEREKEHVTSKGETKKVGEMTVRELQEVKRKLNELEKERQRLEQSNEQAERELEKEKNKQPEAIEKYIEVDNTDYDSINHLNNQLKQMQKDYELLDNEKRAIENEMRITEQENQEHKNLKNQIERLSREKEDIGRQIRATTSISGLVVEVDDFIKDKLAPIKYSQAITEMGHDDIVIRNLSEILGTVQSWCDEMRTYLPNERKNINMEVID